MLAINRVFHLHSLSRAAPLGRLWPGLWGSLLALALLLTAPLLQAFEYRGENLRALSRARLAYDFLLGSSQPDSLEERQSLRRASVGVLLLAGHSWRLRSGFNFVDEEGLDDGELSGVALEYRGDRWWWELGRAQEPFGLAEQTGSQALALMERPQVAILGPDANTGVALNTRGDSWAFTMGAYWATDSEIWSGPDPTSALTMRLSMTPIHRRRSLLHLGLSGSLRWPDTEDLRVQFIAPPEGVLVSGLNLSSASMVGVERYAAFGVEVAWRHASTLLSAEYILVPLREPEPSPLSATLQGGYVELSHALTGEQRGYSSRRGVFSGIRPRSNLGQGGRGAWELAGRISWLQQQSDQAFPEDSVLDNGEDGWVASLGLNWYPWPRVKWMLNAQYVVEESIAGRETAQVIQTRLETSF